MLLNQQKYTEKKYTSMTFLYLPSLQGYLFTKSKPKFKLLHDLCSFSTLFTYETFLSDGINDCEIHIPELIVILCDRFSREGGAVCIYLRNSISFKTCLYFILSL